MNHENLTKAEIYKLVDRHGRYILDLCSSIDRLNLEIKQHSINTRKLKEEITILNNNKALEEL